jgi:glutamate 5-kinase
VVRDAITEQAVGTAVRPRPARLSSRKLWIAFALPSSGRVVVDAGARRALTEQGRSLLPAGVVGIEGDFDADDAVEVVAEGVPFAKGLARSSAATLRTIAGRQTGDLPEGAPHEVIHRDDLVVLPT